MHRFAASSFAIIAIFVTTCTSAQEAGPSYTVDLSDALNHYVTVTMMAETDKDETEVMMATWTPGSYLVREYAKHVDRITATAGRGRGRAMKMEKISKNRWRIDTSKNKKFKLTYRLYCNELSVRTNWVGQAYGVLNGAATFITLPDQLDRSHTISLVMPDNWKRSSTSLVPGDQAHQYVATNYDELVDSPIVAGNINLYPFKVAGVEHTLVNVNEAGYWDGQKAANDLAKIVKAHHDLWGVVPYERYYFQNVIGGGGGGLEHDNSCLMMTSRWSFRSEGSYVRWLSLASHEFFHTWNIRRLRPKALVDYDYENEVYTPSLWIAEGVTSYYEDLLLVRCGLMSEDEFLAGLGSSISRVQRTEGRKVQSLRDSSHDAWIKFYRPEQNSSDTTISYYTKGALVAFLLDTEIRSRSGGERSLDDVMRKLYADHKNPVGYLPSDFRRICSEMAGEDLSDFFRRSVDSTDELDWQTCANWFGFQIGDFAPLKPGDEPKPKREPRESRTRWIGVGVPGSPASKAGLADTDEIIAIDGLRMSGSLSGRLQQYEIGDAITVLISRDDKIMEVAVTIGSRMTTPSWGLSVSRQQTDEQEGHVDDWLAGIPEPQTSAEKEINNEFQIPAEEAAKESVEKIGSEISEAEMTEAEEKVDPKEQGKESKAEVDPGNQGSETKAEPKTEKKDERDPASSAESKSAEPPKGAGIEDLIIELQFNND